MKTSDNNIKTIIFSLRILVRQGNKKNSALHQIVGLNEIEMASQAASLTLRGTLPHARSQRLKCKDQSTMTPRHQTWIGIIWDAKGVMRSLPNKLFEERCSMQ